MPPVNTASTYLPELISEPHSMTRGHSTPFLLSSCALSVNVLKSTGSSRQIVSPAFTLSQAMASRR